MTGIPDQRRFISKDAQTERHRRGSYVNQGQEVAENDPGDIRIIRDVLFTNHREQNFARTVRPACAEHHRVRAHLLDHVHQPNYLRSDELRIPTSLQKLVNVQEFTGTTADAQRSD